MKSLRKNKNGQWLNGPAAGEDAAATGTKKKGKGKGKAITNRAAVSEEVAARREKKAKDLAKKRKGITGPNPNAGRCQECTKVRDLYEFEEKRLCIRCFENAKKKAQKVLERVAHQLGVTK